MSKISRADSPYSRALTQLYTQAKLAVDGSDNQPELLKAARTFVLVAAFDGLAERTGAELIVRLNETGKKIARLNDEFFFDSQTWCSCKHLVGEHALRGKHRCLEPGCKCKRSTNAELEVVVR